VLLKLKKKKLKRKSLLLLHFKAFWVASRYFFAMKQKQKNKEKMWEKFTPKYRPKIVSKKKNYKNSKLKFRKLYK